MEIERIVDWINANQGVLQAVGMLAAGAGVLLSPLGRWLRRRLRGAFGDERSERAPEPQAPAPPPDRASIAVLPFEAASSDPEHEYLVDGLVEDLVTLLARLPGFFVIARASTLAYRGQAVDVREVGRELGVRYVLQGSLRKLGDRLRVSAQLVETERGTNVWTGRFDRSADELPQVQDELTNAIVARLEPELVRAESDLAQRRRPADWDAWSYYQRAQARLMLAGWHEDTFEEATELLRKAISIDPDFALARAQLALLLAFARRIGLHIDRDAAQRESLAEGERALALEGDRSEVQGYVGCAIADLGQPERGIPILERAIETNPSNAQAWVALGAARLASGDAQGAVDALEHGLRISPQDNRLAVWGAFHAAALGRLGRLDEALEAARQACRRDPRAYMPRVIHALILAGLGRQDEARAALAEAREVRPKLCFEELEILLTDTAEALRPAWEELEQAREQGEPARGRARGRG